MPKTVTIRLRIEPDIKAQAEAVFSSLGITVTDAINVFLHSSIMEGGFPFQPKHSSLQSVGLETLFEAHYGKPMAAISREEIGPYGEIDWGNDVGGEIIE